MLRKLTKRERVAIYGLSGVVCLFIVVRFIVFPSIDKRDRLKRVLQVKAESLEEMIALKAEYSALNQRANLSRMRLESRKKDFTLFSFLDRLTGVAGIKERVTYMKPSTSVQKDSPYKISQVEMKLQSLTLEQLTTYLHMIETSTNMVYVKRLSILKTGNQEGFIDAIIQVEAVEK